MDGTHLRVNAFVNAFVDAFVNAFVDAVVNAFVNGFRWLAGKRKTQCRTHDMPKTRCRAQPLLPWPADGVFAGVALGLLSRALLLQLVRPKSS